VRLPLVTNSKSYTKDTIITSFPRRWGRNKPDPSAIQKRIRIQLETARDNEIQSVFDLALLIIDQCSRTFFDRVRPEDLEPLVLDSFANAIGRIVSGSSQEYVYSNLEQKNKQSLAFSYFWQATHEASASYNQKHQPENVYIQKKSLDINPEGKLSLEIQDILDELNIISRVKDQQDKVAKSFVKYMEQIDIRLIHPDAAVAHPDRRKAVEWTKQRAEHLWESLQTQNLELENMKQAAEQTSNAVRLASCKRTTTLTTCS
jgi:hypothetical protein